MCFFDLKTFLYSFAGFAFFSLLFFKFMFFRALKNKIPSSNFLLLLANNNAFLVQNPSKQNALKFSRGSAKLILEFLKRVLKKNDVQFYLL